MTTKREIKDAQRAQELAGLKAQLAVNERAERKARYEEERDKARYEEEMRKLVPGVTGGIRRTRIDIGPRGSLQIGGVNVQFGLIKFPVGDEGNTFSGIEGGVDLLKAFSVSGGAVFQFEKVNVDAGNARRVVAGGDFIIGHPDPATTGLMGVSSATIDQTTFNLGAEVALSLDKVLSLRFGVGNLFGAKGEQIGGLLALRAEIDGFAFHAGIPVRFENQRAEAREVQGSMLLNGADGNPIAAII